MPGPMPTSNENWMVFNRPMTSDHILDAARNPSLALAAMMATPPPAPVAALTPKSLMPDTIRMPEAVAAEPFPEDPAESVYSTPLPQGEGANSSPLSNQNAGQSRQGAIKNFRGIAGLMLTEQEETAVVQEIQKYRWVTEGDDRRAQYLAMVVAIRAKMLTAMASVANDVHKAKALEAWHKATRGSVDAWAQGVGLDTKAKLVGQSLTTCAGLLAYIDDFNITLEKAESALKKSRPGEYLKFKKAWAQRDLHAAAGGE